MLILLLLIAVGIILGVAGAPPVLCAILVIVGAIIIAVSNTDKNKENKQPKSRPKKESKSDIEKRELFYKIKRQKLGAIALPIILVLLSAIILILKTLNNDSSSMSYFYICVPISSVLCYVSMNKHAKKLNEELLKMGGLTPNKEKEYTQIFNKAWTKQFIIWGLIIFFGILFIWGGRNLNKPKETALKKCSFCGEMVDENEIEGNWCKSCQNNAFGEDGWYYDTQK